MLISNRFIDLGEVQRALDLAELAFLIFAVLRLSGYTREELGLGGEFSVARHVLFPFAFFVLPLFVVFFVPHRTVSPGLFALYVINFVLVAGIPEELLFRGLLFASLEERFGWVGALVGATLLHWVAHVFVGLNLSRLVASFVLTSYRLTFRRIEPLIIVHALWDATFIALRPKSVGFSALLLILPVFVGTLLSLIVFFMERGSSGE
ncbi:CPBP family intramembrane glutamic endopeptidase [Thermococcus sp.]